MERLSLLEVERYLILHKGRVVYYREDKSNILSIRYSSAKSIIDQIITIY